MNNDLEAAIKDLEERRKASTDHSEGRAYDIVSFYWSLFVLECSKPDHPDVASLLRDGRIREAFGVAFEHGVRHGELRAHCDPARHRHLGEVRGIGEDPGDPDYIAPAKDFLRYRERFALHARAQEIINEECSRACKSGDVKTWKERVVSKGELIRKCMDKKIPRHIAEDNIPEDWPKGLPGPKRKPAKKPAERPRGG